MILVTITCPGRCVCVWGGGGGGGGGLCLQVCHGLCMYVHVHMGTADLRGSTCKQTLHSNRGHLWSEGVRGP